MRTSRPWRLGSTAEAARLTEVWLLATEDRFRAELALGVHNRLVGDIERMVGRPSAARGGLGAARGRASTGRSVRARRSTRCGAPGRCWPRNSASIRAPELRRLEAAVLNHEPSLDARPAPGEGGAGHGRPAGDRAGRPGRLAGPPDPPSRRHLRGPGHAGAGDRANPASARPGLARALTATAAAMGLHTGWGRCEEAARAPPLWPWTQALAPPPGLPEGDGTTADLDTVAFRLAEATAALLRETGPALLVLDDLPLGRRRHPPPGPPRSARCWPHCPSSCC